MAISINGTSGISGVDGSAATPALQGSDSNTGISFGTDQVNINTGGSTRATVDSSGRLLVATSSSLNVAGREALTQIRASGTQASLSIARTDDTGGGGGIQLAADYEVSSDTQLGTIKYVGNDGTDVQSIGASIDCFVDGTPGTNDMPGRLVFSTTADGASNPTERMRISANGVTTFAGTVNCNRTTGTASTFKAQLNGVDKAYIRADGVYYGTNTTIQNIASERRLKENIVPISSDVAWETIKSVPYYAYNFIDSDPSSVAYGPMADEVPDEMRIATDRSDDVGVIHTFDNGMLQARLYTALQTALTRIEQLETKVAALEGGAN